MPPSRRKLWAMSAEILLHLANDVSELHAAAEKTTDFLEAHHASPKIIFAANLAIEEIVTNIIKYGYDDDAPHVVDIRLSLENNCLHITIIDDGHEFDPFDHPEPDVNLPLEEREPGGLGIHFVKSLLDSCAYCRREGKNIVTLTKNLE